MKPTLGYPSRKDAILALLARDVSVKDIAIQIGISPATVAVQSHYGRLGRLAWDGTRSVSVRLPAALTGALGVHAKARKMDIGELARALLEAACDGCIDALLDDKDDLAP